MDNCNDVKSPATVNALGTDAEGRDHVETWQYASVIGMLMYLASNMCPELPMQCTGVHGLPIMLKRVMKMQSKTIANTFMELSIMV